MSSFLLPIPITAQKPKHTPCPQITHRSSLAYSQYIRECNKANIYLLGWGSPSIAPLLKKQSSLDETARQYRMQWPQRQAGSKSRDLLLQPILILCEEPRCWRTRFAIPALQSIRGGHGCTPRARAVAYPAPIILSQGFQRSLKSAQGLV